jgi:hypothetical protein
MAQIQVGALAYNPFTTLAANAIFFFSDGHPFNVLTF